MQQPKPRDNPAPQAWPPAAFVGGDPALDFLNTVNDHGKTRTQSRIAHWADFLGWAQVSGAFEAAELDTLKTLAQEDATPGMLDEVHRLREQAHAVLAPLAQGETANAQAVAALESRLREAIQRASLIAEGNVYRWQAGGAGRRWLVDVLALGLERLLRSPQMDRLRLCGRCTWLFIDNGRGRGRRWCDMRTCGNRAKGETYRRS